LYPFFFLVVVKRRRKTKEPDLVSLSTRSPGREEIPGKIPTVRTGSAAETSRGKRGDCWREEGDGREEGVATPLESLRVLLLVVDLKVVQISQETRQVTDGVSKGVSVILPNNRKGMTFVGQALAV
jgi:hypothetical protein